MCVCIRVYGNIYVYCDSKTNYMCYVYLHSY